MENYLFKKSYQLKSFKNLSYKSLWGCKGIFTTIRLYGKSKNLILIDDHIKKFNKSTKEFNINLKLTKKFILKTIEPHLLLIKYDHLLRIACNKKILSISLRKRNKISKNFSIKLYSYVRPLYEYKHLKYKKILNLQKKINIKNEEIIFYNNKSLLEGSTSNLIAVKKNNLYIPKSNYYYGVTLKYLLANSGMNIIKKNFKIQDLQNFSELLIVGSGKEVVSVSYIKNIKWKRSSTKIYKKLKNTYNKLLI